MFRNLQNLVPVLFQITNLSERGYGYFKLDNLEYSLVYKEQEVLLISHTYF